MSGDLYMKVYLEQRIASGKCRSCPKARDSAAVHCAECRAKNAVRERRRRATS